MTQDKKKDVLTLTVNVVAEIADNTDNVTTLEMAWNAPLSILVRLWASRNSVPEEEVGLADDEEDLPLTKTPLDLKWSDPATVFAVPTGSLAAKECDETASPTATKKQSKDPATATKTSSSTRKRQAPPASRPAPAPVAKQSKRDAPPCPDEGSPPGLSEKVRYVQSNPKRQGSAGWSRFEGYKSATTPQEALNLGAAKGDMLYDWKKGYYCRA